MIDREFLIKKLDDWTTASFKDSQDELDNEAYDSIRSLILTAPDADVAYSGEDVKRLVDALTELIERRERAVREYPGRSADGSDGRYARARAALAHFWKRRRGNNG